MPLCKQITAMRGLKRVAKKWRHNKFPQKFCAKWKRRLKIIWVRKSLKQLLLCQRISTIVNVKQLKMRVVLLVWMWSGLLMSPLQQHWHSDSTSKIKSIAKLQCMTSVVVLLTFQLLKLPTLMVKNNLKFYQRMATPFLAAKILTNALSIGSLQNLRKNRVLI